VLNISEKTLWSANCSAQAGDANLRPLPRKEHFDALANAGKGKWEERRPPHGGHPERVLILCPTVRHSTPPG
jgi:hypothetical protein